MDFSHFLLGFPPCFGPGCVFGLISPLQSSRPCSDRDLLLAVLEWHAQAGFVKQIVAACPLVYAVLSCVLANSSVDAKRAEIPFAVSGRQAKRWISGLKAFEMKGINRCRK